MAEAIQGVLIGSALPLQARGQQARRESAATRRLSACWSDGFDEPLRAKEDSEPNNSVPVTRLPWR